MVRGLVTDVRPRDLGHADSITLQTEQGRIVQFRVANTVTFTPGHLREHLVFAEPVTVTYVDGPDGPVATAITD